MRPPLHTALRAAIRKPVTAARDRLFRRLVLCLAVVTGIGPVSVLPRAWSAAETPAGHEMWLCAAVNRNYVIGSKVVTLSGIYRRTESGGFEHFGLNFMQIFSIAFDPRDHRVFYTANLNGCFQSKDGGKTWRTSTSWDMTEAKDICIDGNAPDNVYLALPDGIAVSNDRGGTWTRRENGLPRRGKYTQTIKVDRTRTGRVLAGCESGIYLTENGAKSWRRVQTATTTVTELQQSPHDPKLWLATSQSDGVLISRDGGRNWKRIEALSKEHAWYSVAFDPTQPSRWVVCGWHYGVLTSEDAGGTWTKRNTGLPELTEAFRVSVDPDTGRLYLSLWRKGLYASDDFGRTWRFDGIEGGTIYSFTYLPKGAK